jgi:1-phosphatidylinositol-4-phosphate 5-kinase
MESSPSSLKAVKRALALAEEGARLEAVGKKREAVVKFADACDILMQEAPQHPALRAPLESLMVRAEKNKAEAVWEQRARVTRLYDDSSAAAASASCLSEQQPKGVGTFVSVGHASFPLVECLMETMRVACRGDSGARDAEMTPAMLVEAEQVVDMEETKERERFRATLYYPAVFRQLRARVFGLELLDSIGSRGMFELASPGKSGSFLFFTSDMQFLVKTVSGEEKEAFQCPDYYHHMSQHRDSLLNRIVLCASLTRLVPAAQLALSDYAKRLLMGEAVIGGDNNQSTLHFVVLENIIPPHRSPVELYDLKGSTLGRSAAKEQEKARDSGKLVILKDLDVRRKLSVTAEMGRLLIETLERDAAWLQRQNVMDYSLLLAVCREEENESKSRRYAVTVAGGDYCTCCGNETATLAPCPACRMAVCGFCCDESRGLAPCHLCYGFEACPILGNHLTVAPLPVAPRHASLFRSHDGGIRASTADGLSSLPETYFIGVIDFLQPFNLRKQVEQKVKTVVLAGGDERQISVLQPDKYAARLVEFVKKLL